MLAIASSLEAIATTVARNYCNSEAPKAHLLHVRAGTCETFTAGMGKDLKSRHDMMLTHETIELEVRHSGGSPTHLESLLQADTRNHYSHYRCKLTAPSARSQMKN